MLRSRKDALGEYLTQARKGMGASMDASTPQGTDACPHKKQTPRSDELKHDVTCRINRVIGQLTAERDHLQRAVRQRLGIDPGRR